MDDQQQLQTIQSQSIEISQQQVQLSQSQKEQLTETGEVSLEVIEQISQLQERFQQLSRTENTLKQQSTDMTSQTPSVSDPPKEEPDVEISPSSLTFGLDSSQKVPVDDPVDQELTIKNSQSYANWVSVALAQEQSHFCCKQEVKRW